MAASPVQDFQGPLRAAKKLAGWYILIAVLFIVLGVFSIVEPAAAALGVTVLVGWLLIFGGLAYLIGACAGREAKQVIFQIAIGITYLIGGRYSLMHPHLAIGTLTLLLGAVILTGGVVEIISYFRLKREDASGWLLLNGIINLLLAGMILFHWPSSSIWAIGILVGLTLLMTGMARLMFALAVRKLTRLAAR
ncbi:MAG TPA: DUF308 domain-containing protein [Candidatus Acidoferrum sp.]|nr:DUF308 domain-containing protein [Candidatus Acidoferrum sp.]